MFLAGLILSLVASAIHILFRRKALARDELVAIFLRYQFALGAVFGLLAFVGHGFNPVQTASRIGWVAHPQFQFELGSFELGSAIATLLCLFIRNKHFWLATAIPSLTMLLLTAGLHAQEMVARANYAPYNSLQIVSNLCLAVAMGVPLFLYFRMTKAKQ